LVVSAVVTLAILVGVGVWGFTTRPWESVVVREECSATANGATYTLAPEQAHYAAQIGAISLKRNLPIRAATIATATAMQESSLKNLDYGDTAGPDSRGLFQQRPSQGWGTEAQIMNTTYAINAFYDALVKVTGYQAMSITAAAQAVQRSALPDAYATREPQARAFAAAFRGQTEANLTCKLRAADSAGDPQAAMTALASDLGITGTAGATSVTAPVTDRQHGWAVAHWAVANAQEYGIDSVTYAGQTWTRAGSWSAATTSAAAGSSSVQIVFHT
jgi:hypothetical protein